MKLQNAYVTEANAIGGYTMVGYEIPGSSTFDYTASTDIGAGATIEVASLTATKNGWQAKNKVALNNCVQNNLWVLGVKKASTGSGVDYLGSISTTAAMDGSTFATDCAALTSSFKTISDNN